MTPIVRTDPERRTNAAMIADLATLGHLRHDWVTLDATWGLGAFWRQWQPATLIGADADPAKARDLRADFTRLPFADHSIDAVVFDPPYGLSGTPEPTFGARYGLTGAPWQQVMAVCLAGLHEALRVARHVVIAKCQDQVVSGRMVWQTHIFAAEAAGRSARLVDALHVHGYRRQPLGRSQRHARQTYSAALVLEVAP